MLIRQCTPIIFNVTQKYLYGLLGTGQRGLGGRTWGGGGGGGRVIHVESFAWLVS